MCLVSAVLIHSRGWLSLQLLSIELKRPWARLSKDVERNSRDVSEPRPQEALGQEDTGAGLDQPAAEKRQR